MSTALVLCLWTLEGSPQVAPQERRTPVTASPRCLERWPLSQLQPATLALTRIQPNSPYFL